MSFDDVLSATIRDAVREAVREEVARLVADLKPAKRVDLPSYLSAEDAAAIADVTPDTVRAWVSEGRLPRYGAGRLIRVRLDDLEAFLRRCGEAGVAEADLDAKANAILERRRR